MRIGKIIGDLLELAVMTTFVLVVIWDEHRAARRGELVRREL